MKGVKTSLKVKVKSVSQLRKALDGDNGAFDLSDGTNVRGLISRVIEMVGDEVSLHFFQPGSGLPIPHIPIMVNGKDIHFLNGVDTVLRDGDEVLILTLVAGG